MFITSIAMLTLTLLVAILVRCSYTDARRPVRCNSVIHLELGESFSFDRFPPPSPQHELLHWSPRECSWTFMAVGECMLTFRSTHYQRGDIDCEEQFLTIGDENKEKRVCGFGLPPRRFNSTGRHLIFTHFQRSGRWRWPRWTGGRGETINSYVGGVVSCEKVPPPPPPPCELPTQECFDVEDKQCFTSGHCPLEKFEPPPTVELTSCTGTGDGSTCVVHWQYCHSSVPLAQTCPVNLTAIPPIQGTFGCVTHDVPCTIDDPNCGAIIGRYKFSVDELGTDSHPCSSAGRLCSRRALFCFSKT